MHFQVDGGADCRGFSLIMLLGLLLALNWIDRVTICSLIPGHTHEDIDALFSMFRKALNNKEFAKCQTWAEIIERCKTVYYGWSASSRTDTAAGCIEILQIDEVFDFLSVFGIGAGGGKQCNFQSPKHPQLAGLFGVGGDPEKKPSRFLLERNAETKLPEVTAYFSAVANSLVFKAATPIFRSAPNILEIRSVDLQGPFDKQMLALRKAMSNAKTARKCAISAATISFYSTFER